MPWRGVTVSEQGQCILEEQKLNYFSDSDWDELVGIYWGRPAFELWSFEECL